MSKKIAITGFSGIVGSVLIKNLAQEFKLFPLPHHQCDLTKWDQVQNSIANDTDVIIHLAWKAGDLYKQGKYDADNVLMTLNVLEAAAQKKIARVVLASSVHANEYRSEYLEAKMPVSSDWPTSIYGATKLYFEALGRYYAKYRGLEVIAVRLGGVNRENSATVRIEPDYDKIFLSHDDLVKIFRHLINKPQITAGYECVYATSKK